MLPPVGVQTAAAVLASVREERKPPAAPLSQGIEGAIAEQAVEILRVRPRVTGEILTFPVRENMYF